MRGPGSREQQTSMSRPKSRCRTMVRVSARSTNAAPSPGSMPSPFLSPSKRLSAASCSSRGPATRLSAPPDEGQRNGLALNVSHGRLQRREHTRAPARKRPLSPERKLDPRGRLSLELLAELVSIGAIRQPEIHRHDPRSSERRERFGRGEASEEPGPLDRRRLQVELVESASPNRLPREVVHVIDFFKPADIRTERRDRRPGAQTERTGQPDADHPNSTHRSSSHASSSRTSVRSRLNRPPSTSWLARKIIVRRRASQSKDTASSIIRRSSVRRPR